MLVSEVRRVHFPDWTVQKALKHEKLPWWRKLQPPRPKRVQGAKVKRKDRPTAEDIERSEDHAQREAHRLRFEVNGDNRDSENFFKDPENDPPFMPTVEGGILKPPQGPGRRGEWINTSRKQRSAHYAADDEDGEVPYREFIVDSGASFHIISKKDLTKSELKTLRPLQQPFMLPPANGDIKANEEALLRVRPLQGEQVTAIVVKEAPALLSLGKLCNKNGFEYHWRKRRRSNAGERGHHH